MTKSFSKLFLIPLTALVAVSFGMAPAADARVKGGGGGGDRKQVNVNNNKRDVRSTNVRSTSVNNVNVNSNKNVNVNVNNNNRHHGNNWDDDYHPVGTAIAVTAAVVVTSAIVGSMVRTVPPGCVPVNYGGIIYQQCGNTWYQPQGPQFVVINPPY